MMHNRQLEQEVAERAQIEHALRQSEERFKAQYKGMPVPTYTWQMQDDDLVLIDYNDAAEIITQGGIKQMLGTRMTEIYRNAPDIIADMTACYEEKTIRQKEMSYRLRTTGEEKVFNVRYVFVPPDLVLVHTEDITKHRQTEHRLEQLNHLNESLFYPGSLTDKLKRVTDGIVEIFDADFARIWITKPGDLSESGCFHAGNAKEPHACKYRERCLHLIASSGRYSHTDGEVHRRVPRQNKLNLAGDRIAPAVLRFLCAIMALASIRNMPILFLASSGDCILKQNLTAQELVSRLSKKPSQNLVGLCGLNPNSGKAAPFGSSFPKNLYNYKQW
jgi:hypothetical protein